VAQAVQQQTQHAGFEATAGRAVNTRLHFVAKTRKEIEWD